MVKDYRHLDLKSMKRIIAFKKLKDFSKKAVKWWFIILGIIVLFLVGVISFYFSIDRMSGKEKNNLAEMMNFKNSSSQDDYESLNELGKKEIERETEKEKIISDSNEKEGYDFNPNFYNFKDWNDKCPLELMVVNCENKLSSEFKPEIRLCKGKEVNKVLVEDLDKMISDAKKDGIILWISSGYRSVERQTMLFNRQVDRQKSKELISTEEAEKRAAKVVARPYTSEHNTGLAIDFNGVEDSFYKTKEYKWLMDNAHKYGFIERYQEKWKERTGVIYEPWHFRYVGKKHAPLIRESGLCLEEYIKTKLIENKSEEIS